VADVYSFEVLSLDTLVNQTLRDFSTAISDGGFVVDLDVSQDLPMIRADRTAFVLLLSNVVDNALRYSDTRRDIHIRGYSEGNLVRLEITDHGVGIPERDLANVTRKFFRSEGARPSGTGLGLAIAEQIVRDFHGTMTITSTVGVGTTVTLDFGVAGVADEKTHSRGRRRSKADANTSGQSVV
jgi:signal transduction histidine kinase